jgi:hypothetical protein
MPFLVKLPHGTFFDCVNRSDKVEFQATHIHAEDLRRQITEAFEVTEPWQKTFAEGLNWWEYTTIAPCGLALRIYADVEGPRTCTKVEETVTVEEDVPVAYEKRPVTRTVTRWVCPEGSDNA